MEMMVLRHHYQGPAVLEMGRVGMVLLYGQKKNIFFDFSFA